MGRLIVNKNLGRPEIAKLRGQQRCIRAFAEFAYPRRGLIRRRRGRRHAPFGYALGVGYSTEPDFVVRLCHSPNVTLIDFWLAKQTRGFGEWRIQADSRKTFVGLSLCPH